MDDPSALVAEPHPVPRRQPETIREALRGIRHGVFGIELTMLAALVALLFGPSGVGGLVAFVMGFAGLVLVLESMEA